MKWVFAIFVFTPLVLSCGVNPERGTNLPISTSSSLKVNDDDPIELTAAIHALEELKKISDTTNFAEIGTHRADILSLKNEEKLPNRLISLSEHPKSVIILEKLHAEDRILAERLGSSGTPLLDTSRESTASIEAVKTFEDALQVCASAKRTANLEELKGVNVRMKKAFADATRLDGKIMRFSGKNASGKIVDFPFEHAVCRFEFAEHRESLEFDLVDMEPLFPDLSSAAKGCAKVDLNVEARQESKGVFGPYLLTSKSGFAEKAPAFKPMDCASIPPTSDAPKEVISLIKSNVQWLSPKDILSIKTKFLNREDEGVVVKSGIVSVLRTDVPTRTNACGTEESLVVCSQIGNLVSLSFDYGSYYIERASFHRERGEGKRCKKMLNKTGVYTSKNLEYDGKLIYQTSKGRRLQPSEIKTKIEALKNEVETLSAFNWCDHKKKTIN